MIACIDTYYTDDDSRTGLVLFENWTDCIAVQEIVNERSEVVAEYAPGRFFERELPCILAMQQYFMQLVDTLIIDGYVWLNQSHKKGLGALLYDAVERSINVIGVAKNRFEGSAGIEVLRGSSMKPLIITAAGIDDVEAAELIQTMHGAHRIPTLIKRADYLSRYGI